MSDYLTVIEAARETKVSKRTIYNWVRNHKLPFVTIASGSIRIDRADLYRPGVLAEMKRRGRPKEDRAVEEALAREKDESLPLEPQS